MIIGLSIIARTANYYNDWNIVGLIGFFLNMISSGVTLATLYAITINRLLGTTYPFWYKSNVTKKKFYIGLLCCSVVAVVLNTGGNVLIGSPTSSPTARDIGFGMISFLYLFFFVVCVYTYTSIFLIIFRSRQNSQTNYSAGIFRFFWTTIKQGGYVVPLFITSTYLLFVVLPFISFIVCGYGYSGKCLGVALKLWGITHPLNNISDALIYVFGDKDIRTHLKQIYTRNTAQDTDERNNIQMHSLLSEN